MASILASFGKGETVNRTVLARNSLRMSFKLVCAQMDCKLGDLQSNLQTIRKIASAIAKEKSPDIVVFPELATTGYCLGRKWKSMSEEIPGSVTLELSRIASEHGFYIVCGVDEKYGDSIFDSAVLIDPNGRLIGTYRKVHLWDSEKKYFSRGKNFPVFDTRFCKLGIGICYDLEFPESARTMALKGADVLLFPSAEINPMSRQIDSYLLSRSAENCVFVGFSNRVGREGSTVSFFGHSQIVSPDATIAMIKQRQQYVTAQLDLHLLVKMRRKQLPYLNERQNRSYLR
jgi:5-aminopentanamidase